MFELSFDTTTCLPYDLTRSTEEKPYILDFGYRLIADDREVIGSMDPTGEFASVCMLSPAEREYGMRPIELNEEEIGRLMYNAAVFFSKKGTLHPEQMERGFHDGIEDAMNHGYRNAFAIEAFRPANYLVGYMLGEALTLYRGLAKRRK